MDSIKKFQPHRTMSLQGFDGYGAAAALWGASETGFSVSGVFRDQGDFAVLLLFQKDDPFGHPRFSYLPDGNISGLKLDFDIEFQGIQAFESKRWPWIDWAYINAYDEAGNLLQHSLLDLATTMAKPPKTIAFSRSGVNTSARTSSRRSMWRRRKAK